MKVENINQSSNSMTSGQEALTEEGPVVTGIRKRTTPVTISVKKNRNRNRPYKCDVCGKCLSFLYTCGVALLRKCVSTATEFLHPHEYKSYCGIIFCYLF